MLTFLAGRLLSLAASLAVASAVVFALTEVVPGDPAAYMLGLNADPYARSASAQAYAELFSGAPVKGR